MRAKSQKSCSQIIIQIRTVEMDLMFRNRTVNLKKRLEFDTEYLTQNEQNFFLLKMFIALLINIFLL